MLPPPVEYLQDCLGIVQAGILAFVRERALEFGVTGYSGTLYWCGEAQVKGAFLQSNFTTPGF